jgi:hypothetical protein
MPSFGSVTNDQLGAAGAGELEAVPSVDTVVGALVDVWEPAPGPAAPLAAAGLEVVVAAVFFESEHPGTAPTRRSAARTATIPGHCRRHRG